MQILCEYTIDLNLIDTDIHEFSRITGDENISLQHRGNNDNPFIINKISW